MSADAHVAGVLLAAGAGRRMGQPKALVRDEHGEAWVVRGTRILLDSGCSPVVVVIGASADEVARVLTSAFGDDPRLVVQRADGWHEGMGASLREGLGALDTLGTEAPLKPGSARAPVGAVVILVDTPSLRVETIARIRADATAAGVHGARHALRQATFGGRPGHPVFLGSAHWAALRAGLRGDSGAKAYLDAHGASRIECSDLESGDDVDSMNITQF